MNLYTFPNNPLSSFLTIGYLDFVQFLKESISSYFLLSCRTALVKSRCNTGTPEQSDIGQFIVDVYNMKRLHSSLDYHLSSVKLHMSEA